MAEETILEGFVNLKGNVLGHLQKEYTRGIQPCEVFLKIVVDKEKIYDLTEKEDLARLRQERADIFNIFVQYSKNFSTQFVQNIEAEFNLQKIPKGSWGYIVCAKVEKEVYDITQPFGNNGFNEAKPIMFEQLRMGDNIDGIIVPVPDTWYEKSFPPAKPDDPKTDPDKFRPGITG